MNAKGAAALLLGLAWAQAHAEVPSAIAIRDAHVVTVSGAELSKGTVLLRNGLIQEVGADLAIPADAWVIEGSGLTVYPGFIDGLSTWGIPDATPQATAARSTPQTNVPRAKGPEDRPQTFSYERAADLVKPTDKRLETVRSAGFTTAATFPARGIFMGLGAMISLAGERGGDMVIAEPIGEEIAFRTAGFRAGFPNSLMGVLSYVRQVYLDLEHYKEAKQLYASQSSGSKRPGYDHTLEGLAEAPRVLLPATQAQQIDRVLSFGPELKSPFVVYGLHEAYRRVDALKQANVPVLVSLKWPQKPKDADPSIVPDYRELEIREQAPSVPGLLAKAGIKFGFYSDGVEAAPDLKKAIKKAIDAGLTRADAIRALTLSVAEVYGVADRIGSIDRGKIANLVVTKGDVFDDKTTVEYVFVDGIEFKPAKDSPGSDSPAGGRPPAGRRPNADDTDEIGDRP